jgi:hypothetical protein
MTNTPADTAYLFTCLTFFGKDLADIKIGPDEIPFLFAILRHSAPDFAILIIRSLKHAVNQTHNGFSLMHVAAENNQASVLNCLLQAGCTHLDTRDTLSSCTPLITAAKMKNGDAMEALVAAGADISLTDNMQNDAMFYVTKKQEVIVAAHPCAHILAQANKGISVQSISVFSKREPLPAQQQLQPPALGK